MGNASDEAECTGLKPCPKCLGISEIKQTGPKEITIRCAEPDRSTGLCGCGIVYRQRVRTHSLDWLREIMTDKWNARPTPPSPAFDAMREALEEMVSAVEGMSGRNTQAEIRVLRKAFVAARAALKLSEGS